MLPILINRVKKSGNFVMISSGFTCPTTNMSVTGGNVSNPASNSCQASNNTPISKPLLCLAILIFLAAQQ